MKPSILKPIQFQKSYVTLFVTFFTILLLLSSQIKGQIKTQKFGKITDEEILMQKYDKQPDAEALILFDDGISKFRLNRERKFQIEFKRHVRIKIFNKNALNLANFRIPLYNYGSVREVLPELKASAFNYENGKIIETKLDNSDIYEENSKYYTDKIFAVPNVKEGSIIEISYSIVSDYLYNLQSWKFQYSYPAVLSQYRIEIPEYFVYRFNSKGYLPFTLNTSEELKTSYTLHFEKEVSNGLSNEGQSGGDYTIEALSTNYVFAIKDVPAFIEEPYIDCKENYMQSLEFELNSIQYPGELRKDYTRTWQTVNKELYEDENLGKLLNNHGFIEEAYESIVKSESSNIENAKAIYSYLQQNIKWNGKYSIWAEKGLKKPFTEHFGSTAEINLLLSAFLRKAGLDANPMIVSTRTNGYVLKEYPTITKFNSLLCHLKIDNQSYILDASCDNCPFGTIPPQNLNFHGRIINDKGGEWIDIEPFANNKEQKTIIVKINADGSMTGEMKENREGYPAVLGKNQLAKAADINEHINTMHKAHPGLEILEIKHSPIKSNEISFKDTLRFKLQGYAESIENKLMFKPLVFETLDSNYFTLKERNYPVNFNFPVLRVIVCEYTVPEGFQIESLPKPTVFKLPDNSISFTYNIQSNADKIMVIYKLNISKTIFLPEEYAHVKSLFDQIVSKNNEFIILSKDAR